jgi:tetratricopeptide (TPR) repeat protein
MSLPEGRRELGRVVIVLAVLFVCVFGALTAARAGLSRLFSEYGSATGSLAASERALGFKPQDPEAHFARAIGLEGAGRSEEAVREFERAVSLRPQDYFFWQELARAREANDDPNGATRALQEAVALAPHYAQPHWQLGNLLLRAERFDQGFAELRLAVNSDALLYPAMMDLAWSFNEGDSASMLAFSRPRDGTELVALASFLMSRDHVDEAMQLLRPTASRLRAEDRASLTKALIASGKLAEAFEVWGAGRAGGDARLEKVFDGGFEEAIDANEQGFGWKPTLATATVHILLDANAPQSDQRSLRLDYAGGFDPAVAVVSQLVIVAPHTRYRLSFSARTEDLKSAALPLVAVKDAGSTQAILARSSPLSDTVAGWQTFALEFETADSSAITINIQRAPCPVNPCPMFGRAWFDSFSLQRQ